MSYDCYCDYDTPEFYHSKIRKARTEHRCYECPNKIQPGENYEYVFGKQDGSIFICRTCERCCDLRTWVKNNVPCFCWAHGNLREDAESAIDEACYRAPKETIGLRFGFLRRIVLRNKHNSNQNHRSIHQ